LVGWFLTFLSKFVCIERLGHYKGKQNTLSSAYTFEFSPAKNSVQNLENDDAAFRWEKKNSG